jgi:uncharacterized protein involved in exopolysaccharide biosynthesis
MEKPSSDPAHEIERTADAGERIVCVVARDVISLERQEAAPMAFLSRAWKGRWLILCFVVGCGALATVYALLATEWYTAGVVLTPAAVRNTPGLSGQLEGLGLLAGLAGSLGLGSTRTAEPIGVLESRDFARQFIEEQGLLHVLLADQWDARAGRWKESDPRLQPDIRDAIDYFDKQVLRVDEDKKTGLVTVSIRWKNAAVAASWANTLVDRLNEQMRVRALAEGEANVAYLQKELLATTFVGVQQAVSRLLEQELQKVMVARGERQFAFRIVDHADVPKHRSWPKRRVIVTIGVLAGGLAGLLVIFVVDFLRRVTRSSGD